LVVFALNGEPGIYSARWAGPSKDFKAAFARLEKELTATGATDYSAKFVCALALITPDGKEEVVEGEVHGSLVFPPRGEYGFGYDPIFVANGLTKTYGEIEAKVKDTINHRADAFKKLKQLLK
jgi:XTP/dITP diphosphohydrolase